MPTWPFNIGRSISCISQFYQRTLNLAVAETEGSHEVLVGPGVEVVIHGMSSAAAVRVVIADPPVPRKDTAFKPAIMVDSLERVQQAIAETGGHLKPIKSAWEIRGARVVDGHDPEGNVVQFKERL